MDELVFLNPLSATATLPQQIKMLKQQLAAALEREKLAMECVELYADESNWFDQHDRCERHTNFATDEEHGYEPAQDCKRKVEAMK